jgi:3-mercaptopyruvate sulfurtransferase SseA
VMNLAGGFSAWQAAGLPVSHDAGEADAAAPAATKAAAAEPAATAALVGTAAAAVAR